MSEWMAHAHPSVLARLWTSASRLRRVLFQRSTWAVSPVSLPTAVCCSCGITCAGYLVRPFSKKYNFNSHYSIVLATWVIRSKNRPLEKGIILPLCLQTKVGEDKIGSRQHILMLERRQSHVKE